MFVCVDIDMCVECVGKGPSLTDQAARSLGSEKKRVYLLVGSPVEGNYFKKIYFLLLKHPFIL